MAYNPFFIFINGPPIMKNPLADPKRCQSTFFEFPKLSRNQAKLPRCALLGPPEREKVLHSVPFISSYFEKLHRVLLVLGLSKKSGPKIGYPLNRRLKNSSFGTETGPTRGRAQKQLGPPAMATTPAVLLKAWPQAWSNHPPRLNIVH